MKHEEKKKTLIRALKYKKKIFFQFILKTTITHKSILIAESKQNHADAHRRPNDDKNETRV